ncbi:MAG: SGNH/GDSL hydrolase family protein, partial [Desulfatitalea sp.]|nr:SGNH/GDSL hydrolase family protein [Desulfatitalea sp.]
MGKTKTSLAVLILLPIALLLGAANALAGPFSEIVVFGDSLSDNGNYVLYEGQPAPDPALYWQGRFSNGPVWVEYLTDPAHFDTNLTGRAFGGAESDGLAPPGLIQQVRTHILGTGPPLSPTNLYVIWIGGNDYFNGDGNSQGAVDNINDAMTDLVDNGALSILILNLPDLGAIPHRLGSTLAPEATKFSVDFNAALASMIDTFSAAHPDINIYEFDIYALFLDIIADPDAFGFDNVTEQSPNFAVEDNFDGGGSLFWDDKHPTTRMHALIADRVYDDLSAQLPTDTPDAPAQKNESSSCFIRLMAWE